MNAPKVWKSEDLKSLQTMCHYYGRDQFIRAIIEVMFRAADDTEDFENKEISQSYKWLAQHILNVIEECEL